MMRVFISIVEGSILEVTIVDTVDNYFLPAIGFADTQQIEANAIAEYEGNVAMGQS